LVFKDRSLNFKGVSLNFKKASLKFYHFWGEFARKRVILTQIRAFEGVSTPLFPLLPSL
jgi:hypothetical protein